MKKCSDRLAEWVLRDERAPHVSHAEFSQYMKDGTECDASSDYILHTDTAPRSRGCARRCIEKIWGGVATGPWDNPSDGVYCYSDESDSEEGGQGNREGRVQNGQNAALRSPLLHELSASPASRATRSRKGTVPNALENSARGSLAEVVVVRREDIAEDDGGNDDEWETVVSKKRERRQ